MNRNDETDLDWNTLYRHVRGATYPVTWEVSNWTSDFSSKLKHSLHRGAAMFYAERYHAEHGRLPEGTHRVRVTVGPSGNKGDADIGYPWHSQVPKGWEVLETDITFPPPPAELVPLLRRDPERSE
jgi:hypothetical protein